MIRLEKIVKKGFNSKLGRFILAGAAATIMLGCEAQASPTPIYESTNTPAAIETYTPNPATPTPKPKKDPTATPEAKPTFGVPTVTPTGEAEATATPVLLPDLAFSNVRHIEGQWGEDYRDGKNYRVEFDVTNLGNTGSGVFYLSVPGLEERLRFEGVEAGKSISVAFDARLPSGSNSLDLVIEAENKANEKDGNNKYDVSIDVNAPFELICDICTDEQKEIFYNNALEDYRTVLEVYGVKEGDARVVITTEKGGTGYAADFYHNDRIGGGGERGLDNFTTDRRGMRHSIGHALNHNLFPEENLKEENKAWYNMFDEGMAMYASGEVEAAKSGKVAFKEPDGSLKIYGWDESINLLVSNPNDFWNRLSAGLPGHTGGLFLYTLLEREGLTPEKNREALSILAESYRNPGTQSNKGMMQDAYQRALNMGLTKVFDTLMDPGVRRLYHTNSTSNH